MIFLPFYKVNNLLLHHSYLKSPLPVKLASYKTQKSFIIEKIKKYRNCPALEAALGTFFLSSGLPFLTVASTMSPLAAAGSLLSLPLMPDTAMMYRFFDPKRNKFLSVFNAHFDRSILSLCRKNYQEEIFLVIV